MARICTTVVSLRSVSLIAVKKGLSRPNEVRHARENPSTTLFILSNVTVEGPEDGTVTVTGGSTTAMTPGVWTTGR